MFYTSVFTSVEQLEASRLYMAIRQSYNSLIMKVLESARINSGSCAVHLTFPIGSIHGKDVLVWQGAIPAACFEFAQPVCLASSEALDHCDMHRAHTLSRLSVGSDVKYLRCRHPAVADRHKKILFFTAKAWHHCRLADVHLVYPALSQYHRAGTTF